MLFFSLQLISNLWANTLGLRSTLFLIQHSPTCFKINLLTVFPTPSLLPYSIFIPFTFSWHSIYLFIYDFISIWTCRLFIQWVTLQYSVPHIVPEGSARVLSSWPLNLFAAFPSFLNTSIISYARGYPRLLMYFPYPSPGISLFPKESGFLLEKNGI